MSYLNKVLLIGNCAARPEVKTTTTGKTLAKLRVATNRYWKDDDGDHKATEWHTVIAWDRQAEICSQFLDKGSRVYVEGRIKTRSWQGDNGEARSVKEIVAQRISFMDSRRGQSGDSEDLPL